MECAGEWFAASGGAPSGVRDEPVDVEGAGFALLGDDESASGAPESPVAGSGPVTTMVQQQSSRSSSDIGSLDLGSSTRCRVFAAR
ncbi:hypothetical protein ACRYGX_17585 [Mycobacteroides abscessus]